MQCIYLEVTYRERCRGRAGEVEGKEDEQSTMAYILIYA